jgi:uncharacterized phage-associated protein
MRSIRFQFDQEKLVQALAFFSLKGVKGLTKMKAAKLLYYADKIHLNRYGRPITGDCYACMDHGPVPSISLNEMNDALETTPEIREEEPALLRVLKIVPTYYPEFSLKDPALFDGDVFSATDLEVLGEVIERYGRKSAWELRQESHRESAWVRANQWRAPGSSTPMSFEDMLESREMLEAVLQDQKDHDDLNSAVEDAYRSVA